MLVSLQDPQSWRDVGWTLVGALSGTAAFALTLTWWAAAVGGLTSWVWQRFIPVQTDTITLASAMGLSEGRGADGLVNFLIGVLALVTLPLVVRFAAAIHASLADVLLTSSAKTQGRPSSRLAGSSELADQESGLV